VFEIVVMAASMGGPDAVRTIVGGLPAEFPAAVVLVQHRTAGSNQVMVDLLRRRTRLPVRLAPAGGRPRPGSIDVAPADRQLMLLSNGGYVATDPDGPLGCAADPLLLSVADCFGPRAIGVILSGTMDDGAAGIAAIKGRGGWVLAQDQASSQQFGMPSAAIATGCVDYVLPLRRIADALVALAMWPGAADFFRTPTPFWARAVA
jgi:two-component system, chemotaxis family, protein-glutamate methylesterase/glutaminase